MRLLGYVAQLFHVLAQTMRLTRAASCWEQRYLFCMTLLSYYRATKELGKKVLYKRAHVVLSPFSCTFKRKHVQIYKIFSLYVWRFIHWYPSRDILVLITLGLLCVLSARVAVYYLTSNSMLDNTCRAIMK